MTSIFSDYRKLLKPHKPPCVSLYQPTHRQHPDTDQDPIRFRNLVRVLEGALRQRYSTRDVRGLLEPFHALSRDHTFWNGGSNGLAVLAAPDLFRPYKLPRPV